MENKAKINTLPAFTKTVSAALSAVPGDQDTRQTTRMRADPNARRNLRGAKHSTLNGAPMESCGTLKANPGASAKR